MINKKLTYILTALFGAVAVSACSKSSPDASSAANASTSKTADVLTVDNQDDAPTIDPAMSRDATSSRVINDLFEGLVSFDQSNNSIPGLAEKWDISPDGKTYTFHLRDGLKFSDGSPITADDVVFSWQRLANPKTGSPYSNLAFNVVNGKEIVEGKKPVTDLAVKAIDKQTVEIKLVNPNSAFLQICAMPNTAVVSKTAVEKFGEKWTDPKNMVTSGAYNISEWVVKGHMMLGKNPNYYDAANVSINKVNFLPIIDQSSSFNQYKTGEVDITYSVPVDQYKKIKDQYPTQLHNVPMEALYYYDFNMSIPKYSQNKDLRQALSMAVDRNVLVKDVLGQDQVPSYSLATATVEGGKFAGNDYAWGKLSHDEQIKQAKELFAKAGFGPKHPLEITIQYNTLDLHKKVALAVASMWQQVFGVDSIKVIPENKEWKTFIQDRMKGNYDIARDGWTADYDSVDTYTDLFLCNNPVNKSKYCNPEFDKLIYQARATQDANERVQLINQAIQIANNDYAIIPLYQYTYYRLVNPRVQNYDIKDNHLDHVQSKWFKLN